MRFPKAGARTDNALVRELEFESFPAAVAFVDRLAELAESENHHPDIDIRYRRVTVRWSTHSAGGVTDRDRDLAVRTLELRLSSTGELAQLVDADRLACPNQLARGVDLPEDAPQQDAARPAGVVDERRARPCRNGSRHAAMLRRRVSASPTAS